MKKRLIWIMLSALLLASGSIFFIWFQNVRNPPKPLASVNGGYYEDAFLLEFSKRWDETIYYTTDGSLPTLESQVYDGGIWIADRSQEENVYHSIPNVVTEWKDISPDSKPVPKGTVIRAITVSRWGYVSDVFTQTYFVGLEPTQSEYTLSLVFNKEDLFGEDGIYVTGKEYDEWYLSGGSDEAMPVANFEKKLEVPVLLEVMDDQGDVLNQQVGIRIQGASSRKERYKRFILVAREEYSGSNVFGAEFFGVNTHSVMLKPFCMDIMAPDIVPDRWVVTQKSKQVDVYLNGEFWYTTYMMERYDDRYFEEYYDIESVVRAENGVEVDAPTDTLPTYLEFHEWVKNIDWADGQAWEELKSKMDVQSYIDFVVINYCVGNIDVNEWQNCRIWRRADAKGNGDNRDTRWKWCIYDIDSGAWSSACLKVEDVASVNTFLTSGTHSAEPLASTVLFRKLIEHPEFRKQFTLSFMDIVNNNFSAERMENILENYGIGLDFVEYYYLKRPIYAPSHLRELLQLQGTVETVSITTANTAGGNITVNTSQINLSDGSWEGKYFTDYPITITANANPGYRFVGWKGAADTEDATITLPVDGGIALEAVFAPSL